MLADTVWLYILKVVDVLHAVMFFKARLEEALKR